MHMADALLSPAVGAGMWAASAGAVGHCARVVRRASDERTVPLMGVLGAFVFAAQMINFAVPGTGSSGHLGGGMLLAILVGPHAALLTMASILAVQAMFFADGGLLAYGANVFNLGVLPCFIAYPLLYRPLAGDHANRARISSAAVVGSVGGLQLGALAVVLQTVASGVTELRLAPFAMLMLPIHLAIGLIEGLATAAVITFVWKAQPDVLRRAPGRRAKSRLGFARLLGLFAIAAVVMGAVLSWVASSRPDGLEWSMAKSGGSERAASEKETQHDVHQLFERMQQWLTLLPDYGFASEPTAASSSRKRPGAMEAPPAQDPWPAVNAGTSVSGLIGGMLTLLLAAGVGLLLRYRAKRVAPE